MLRDEAVGGTAAAEAGRTAGAEVSPGRKARPVRRLLWEKRRSESPRGIPHPPPVGDPVTPARDELQAPVAIGNQLW